MNINEYIGDLYHIDSSGTLVNVKTGKQLLFRKDKDGYLVCNIKVFGKRVTRFQHRMLAVAYLPNLENKPEVNRINGIKSDNRLENLEWVTKSENMRHSINVLGNPKPPNSKGNTGSLSKLSIPVVGVNTIDGTCLIFAGQKDAQRQTLRHFNQSNIQVSLKTGKPYKGYYWINLEEENGV